MTNGLLPHGQTLDIEERGTARLLALERPRPLAPIAHAKIEGFGQRQGQVATVIVDKSALFRAGLIHVLADTNFRVVADCASLSELPGKALSNRRCLLLAGIDGDAEASLEQLSQLRAKHKQLQLIVFGNDDKLDGLIAAVEAGADCCLLKDEITPCVLLKSLELVLLGGVIFSRGLHRRLVSQHESGGRETVAGDTFGRVGPQPSSLGCVQDAAGLLSSRERVILSHLMQGASNKLIARELSIAEATVKVHVKSLLRKIHVRNRTQAAMWGINNLPQNPVSAAVAQA